MRVLVWLSLLFCEFSCLILKLHLIFFIHSIFECREYFLRSYYSILIFLISFFIFSYQSSALRKSNVTQWLVRSIYKYLADRPKNIILSPASNRRYHLTKKHKYLNANTHKCWFAHTRTHAGLDMDAALIAYFRYMHSTTTSSSSCWPDENSSIATKGIH